MRAICPLAFASVDSSTYHLPVFHQDSVPKMLSILQFLLVSSPGKIIGITDVKGGELVERRIKNLPLGRSIRMAREAKRLSTNQLAEAIGSTHSYINKLEAGWFGAISPANVQALSRALDIDAQDLFTLAGYKVPEGLPTLVPYMRTKYSEDLPDEAVSELSQYFDYLRSKYGATHRPLGDEDEDDEH